MKQDLLRRPGRGGHSAPGGGSRWPQAVAAGQIRRLRVCGNCAHTEESPLVAVLTTDPGTSTAVVADVTSPSADLTCVRDVVVGRQRAGLPFDIAIRPDVRATVWTAQLAGTVLVGELPSDIADVAMAAVFMSNQELEAVAAAAGTRVGLAVTQIGDHLWWERGRAAERLARLSGHPAADPLMAAHSPENHWG